MKIALTLLAILLLANISIAQPHRTGYRLNNTKDSKLPKLSSAYKLSNSNEQLPLSSSLREYCPVPGDQEKYNTCAAYALGYAAYTILKAERSHTNDQAEINNLIYSPLYVFNETQKYYDPNACESGATFNDITTALNNHGICYLVDYPTKSCTDDIGPDVLKKGYVNKNTIEVKTLFSNETPYLNAEDKISAIRRSLYHKKPVLLGIKVFDNLNTLTPENSVYIPYGSDNPNMGHAVTCVGYNDDTRQFEVLNSWGTGWGNRGYFSIPYDQVSVIDIAVQVSLKGNIDNGTREISASLAINVKQPDKMFIKQPAFLANGVYNVNGMYQKKFNIELTSGKNPYKYYLINVDPSGNKKVLFPFSPDNADFIPYSVPKRKFGVDPVKNFYSDEEIEPYTTQTIPNREAEYNGLVKSKAETEPLIVLISNQELDIKSIMSEINYGDNYLEKINYALKKYHPQLSVPYNLKFESSVMSYRGPLNSNQVIPMVVNLNQ